MLHPTKWTSECRKSTSWWCVLENVQQKWKVNPIILKTMSEKIALHEQRCFPALSRRPRCFWSDNFVGDFPVCCCRESRLWEWKNSCICSALRREIKTFTTTWQIGLLLINTESFTSACFKHFQTAILCSQMCTAHRIKHVMPQLTNHPWFSQMQTSCLSFNSKPWMNINCCNQAWAYKGCTQFF